MAKQSTRKNDRQRKAKEGVYDWPPADPVLKEQLEAIYTAALACIDEAREAINSPIDGALGPVGNADSAKTWVATAASLLEMHWNLASRRQPILRDAKDGEP